MLYDPEGRAYSESQPATRCIARANLRLRRSCEKQASEAATSVR
jgi:hypothetical protein